MKRLHCLHLVFTFFLGALVLGLLLKVKSDRSKLIELRGRLQTIDQLSAEPPSRGEQEQRLLIKARVSALSDLPEDLSSSPYPHALRLIEVEPLEILYGKLAPQLSKLRVAHWALHNQDELLGSRCKEGQELYLDLVPIAQATDEVRQAMRFDSLEMDFSSEVWVSSLHQQFRFSRLSADRRASIKEFRQRVINPLDFDVHSEAIFSEYKKQFLEKFQVDRTEGWAVDEATELYLRAEDLSIPIYGTVSPLVAIIDLANDLEGRGIQFIYCSLPCKVELYPQKFAPELPEQLLKWMAPQRYELMAALSDAGVQVVDGANIFRDNRSNSPELKLPFFKGTDPHLSAQGCREIAIALGELLRANSMMPENVKGEEFTRQTIAAKLDAKKYAAEPKPYLIEQVVGQNGKPYQPDSDSPLLLVGDSNLFWWQSARAKGAGIGAHLSAELGFSVDEIAKTGLLPHHLRDEIKRVRSKHCVIYLQTAWTFWNKNLPWALFRDRIAESPVAAH